MADDATTNETENAQDVESTDQDTVDAVETTDADAPITSDSDWKTKARQHERAAKNARKKLDDLESKLAEIESANKSDQEKAIEAARKQAAEETAAELTGQIKAERLNSAIARMGAGKFADVDDAIRLIDVDDETIFTDDGKVDTDALNNALTDLLDRKPHLAVGPNGRPAGDADAGKGSNNEKSLNDLSVDEHFADLRRNK
jgi:hypothetical protein